MIELKNLVFSYNDTSNIINNINLKIEEGCYVSILGENGSGKSTLIKLILGILKPSSGNVSVETNKIGYVPQIVESFNSQFPITVGEFLTVHRKALKLKNNEPVNEILDFINMKEYKDTLMGNLSGGQRQKIFIGRALMGYPRLIVLDEPSTGVDVSSQAEIYNILKEINLNKKITIIAVEHNIKAALENSSYICEVENGNAYYHPIAEYKSKKTN